MELWILSQDEMKLCKAHDLIFRENNDSKGNTWYEIVDIYLMGIYKTEARALEVLKEINNYKDKLEKAYFLGMEESSFVSSTFVMPKE